MILRVKLAGRAITLTMARVDRTMGVNSKVFNNNHILMWDFDDICIDTVKTELSRVQSLYCLPQIHIVSTGTKDHYMAYCFKALDWLSALRIVVNTDFIDPNFIRFSAFRGNFTLRVMPKNNKVPHFETILPSIVVADCTPADLLSWVKYDTIRKK